jgi:TonB-linked SusC/RagA family outer membrane protein
MRKLLTIALTLFLFAGGLSAQTLKVNGTVKDDSGIPVPGAAIFVKGTATGVQSDSNGQFTLNAKQGQTLVCSCLGFLEATSKVESGTVNFILKADVQMLEQTIVVGYGGVKKGDLTGSVANVKMEKLASIPTTNSAISNLQGRIAGLQVINAGQGPASDPTIIIRGFSSINGTQSPLVVVDGFPMGEGADLKQINPADIVDVVVLKDASSTSIYGSRGANGVIMVTTRRAAKGTSHINFSQQTVVSQFSSKLNIWRNAALMAQLSNESRVNAGQTALYVGKKDNGVYYPSVSEIQDGTWPYYTKWDDIIMRTPVTNTTTLGISGASDKFVYNLSGVYYNDKGVYIKDDYQKFSVKLDVDYKYNDRFSVRTSNLIYRDWRNVNNGMDVGRNPLWPVYNEDGSYYRASETDYGNPMALTDKVLNKSIGFDAISFLQATWKIFDVLTWTGQLNYKYGASTNDSYNPKVYTEDGTFNNGHAYIGNSLGQTLIPETYLTFDKNYGKHHLNVIGGYSYDYDMARSSSLNAYDFVNESLENENIGAGDPEKNVISNGYSESKLMSLYGKVNYSYDDRYLLTGTFRRDGSSKFGANNKWANFPSAAFAWKLHNEEFMKDVTSVNEAKIRISYGLSGNQGISPYQTLSRYGTEKYYDDGAWNTCIGPGYIDGYYGSNYRFKYWGGIPNKDLKWETTSQFDLGFDLSMFESRYSLTFDWYRKNTYDLLRQSYLSLSSGYDKMWVNDGSVLNQGIEVTLNANVIRTKDMNLNITAIFSRNRNKVLSLGNSTAAGLNTDPNTGMQYEFTGSALTYQPVGMVNILAVGQPMYVFYGYKTDGIIQSDAEGIAAGLSGDEAKAGEIKYVDINNDGTVDEKDRTVIGNPNPDFTASMNLAFSYKKFEASMFLNGVFGNDVLYQYGMTDAASQPLRWTVDNPSNEYPSLRNNRQPKVSEWFVRDGSFVRIQEVNFGYNFGPQFNNAIENVKLYLNVSNLYTFTSFKGYDPEVGVDGIYWGGYPRFRKFSIGLNITF